MFVSFLFSLKANREQFYAPRGPTEVKRPKSTQLNYIILLLLNTVTLPMYYNN